MRIWLILAASGAVTFLSRLSFIAFGDRLSLPKPLERALAFVAPAAFAGISAPLLFGSDGFAGPVDDAPRVIAALLAIGIVYWRRSIPLSLIVGMGSLWLLTWLI